MQTHQLRHSVSLASLQMLVSDCTIKAFYKVLHHGLLVKLFNKGVLVILIRLLHLVGSIHISGMAEARAVKFCTLVSYIKSYQKNKKITP